MTTSRPPLGWRWALLVPAALAAAVLAIQFGLIATEEVSRDLFSAIVFSVPMLLIVGQAFAFVALLRGHPQGGMPAMVLCVLEALLIVFLTGGRPAGIVFLAVPTALFVVAHHAWRTLRADGRRQSGLPGLLEPDAD